jgi:hypothetical protein
MKLFTHGQQSTERIDFASYRNIPPIVQSFVVEWSFEFAAVTAPNISLKRERSASHAVRQTVSRLFHAPARPAPQSPVAELETFSYR